jgi:hypothetical protein
MAVLLRLRKMFNEDTFFDVCSFGTLLDAMGIQISEQEKDQFRLLHCIKYANMGHAMKRELANRVLEVLSRGPVPQFEFTIVETKAPVARLTCTELKI